MPTFQLVGESNRILMVDYYVVSLHNDRHLEFQTMDDLQDPGSVKISWTCPDSFSCENTS
jgi:hypothetical protein